MVPPTAAQPSGPFQIQEHVLDNGFTILLAEGHRRPRVDANLGVRVGSMIKPVGQHGITHFLEHVIHQGTTTIGARDLSAELPILQEIHDTEQELIGVHSHWTTSDPGSPIRGEPVNAIANPGRS